VGSTGLFFSFNIFLLLFLSKWGYFNKKTSNQLCVWNFFKILLPIIIIYFLTYVKFKIEFYFTVLFIFFKYPIINILIFHLSHKSVPTFLLVLVIKNDMGIYPIYISKINITSIKCRLKYQRIEKKNTQILIYIDKNHVSK